MTIEMCCFKFKSNDKSLYSKKILLNKSYYLKHLIVRYFLKTEGIKRVDTMKF